MKKIILILSCLCSFNVLAGQTIYKCVIKGKVVYSNNEKDKDCQHTEITEISKMTVLNKKFPEDKKEQIPEQGLLNLRKNNLPKSTQESIPDISGQTKQFEEMLKKLEKNQLDGLDKAIKASGG